MSKIGVVPPPVGRVPIGASVNNGPTVVVSVPSDDKIDIVTNVKRGWHHSNHAQQPVSHSSPPSTAPETAPLETAGSPSPPAAASVVVAATERGSTPPPAPQAAEEDFEDLDISDQVPLGEILDKLEDAAAAAAESLVRCDDDDEENGEGHLIRLHVDGDEGFQGDEMPTSTISATVNVATLDLSDPDSIHQHLTQLNDTVLKVTASSTSFSADGVAASLALALGVGNSPGYECPVSPSRLETSSVSSSSAGSMQSGGSCYLSPPSHSQQAVTAVSQQSQQQPTAPSPTVMNAVALPTSPVPLHPSPTATAPASVGLPTSPLPIAVAVKKEAPPTAPKATKSSSSKSAAQICVTCNKQFSNASALAKHR